MPRTVFSTLQRANLDNLILIRDTCRSSPGAAALAYAIDNSAIECYALLSDEDLVSIATEIDVSTVVPRFTCHQLKQLIALPRDMRCSASAAMELGVRSPAACG